MGKTTAKKLAKSTGSIYLLLIKSGKQDKVTSDILKNLKSEKGMYVTVNKPYNNIAKKLEDKKINTKSIFFVDAISATTNPNVKRQSNCVYVSSPKNLTDLNIAVNSNIQGKDVIILDSLGVLLVHNDPKTLERFLHVFVSSLRQKNIGCFILTEQEQVEKSLLNVMSTICDEVANIS
jgi:archaellum biogenesis ATPase FlaH